MTSQYIDFFITLINIYYMNELSEENHLKSIVAQSYLLHYNWEYYFDEYHNIHIELNKNSQKYQHDVLFECVFRSEMNT